METAGEAKRVRVYLSEGDTWRHQATHLAILELLRREGAAGASVFKGVAGFGTHGRIHTATLVDLAEPLPLVVEWVDTPERVQRLLPAICEMVGEGLVTVEDVRVARASHRPLRDLPRQVLVRHVMTPASAVTCASPDTSLHDLVLMLLRERRRAVPVVDAERRVTGIITNGDLVERAGLPLRLELLGALGEPARPEVAAHLAGLRGDGRTAASIMTRELVTVTPDTPLADAARLMLERRLKRLPVVDAERRLAGMLSRLDVLATVSDGYARGAGPQAPEGAASAGPAGGGARPAPTQIKEVMNRTVPAVRPDAPLPDVLDAVVSTRLNQAVVVDDDGRPIGLIVDADLLQRVTPAAHPGLIQALMRRVLPSSPEQREQWQRLTAQRAADLMRPASEMLIVPEDAGIAEVIDRSLAQRIKLVAVVDLEGKLAGMADRADLLAALAQAI